MRTIKGLKYMMIIPILAVIAGAFITGCGDDKKNNNRRGDRYYDDRYYDDRFYRGYGWYYEGAVQLQGGKKDNFLAYYGGVQSCNDDDLFFQWPNPCDYIEDSLFYVQMEVEERDWLASIQLTSRTTGVRIPIRAWFEPFDNDSGAMFKDGVITIKLSPQPGSRSLLMEIFYQNSLVGKSSLSLRY